MPHRSGRGVRRHQPPRSGWSSVAREPAERVGMCDRGPPSVLWLAPDRAPAPLACAEVGARCRIASPAVTTAATGLASQATVSARLQATPTETAASAERRMLQSWCATTSPNTLGRPLNQLSSGSDFSTVQLRSLGGIGLVCVIVAVRLWRSGRWKTATALSVVGFIVNMTGCAYTQSNIMV